MSQLQLWVVVAAPSILALIGILLNQTGIARLERRIGALIDRMDHRMDQMMEVRSRCVKDLLG